MRDRMRLSIGLLVGVLLAWVVGACVLFFFPRQDPPGRADAVVVLSGANGPRLRRGLELMRRHVARTLVISDGWNPTWPEANRLCGGRERFAVYCFHPSPFSTRGEARGVAALARAHHWRSVVVVTSTYHVTRARMLFQRCVDGQVRAVGAPWPLRQIGWVLVSETLKLGYAVLVGRSC